MSITTRKNRRKGSVLSKTRWAGYAAAGAAAVLGANEAAEAGIYYSGELNQPVGHGSFISVKGYDYFPIDLTGDGKPDLLMVVGASRAPNDTVTYGEALVVGSDPDWFNSLYDLTGIARVAGFRRGEFSFASLLKRGEFVSHKSNSPRSFLNVGTLAYGAGYTYSLFKEEGTRGYVGFSFDAGEGTQYGWVQVKMDTGPSKNAFTVVDYAYADAGEAIWAGQQSAAVPEPGSLGLLATGGIGLLLWRRARRNRQPQA